MTHRVAPPSMAPSRQPKSLLTVLKGISAPRNPSDMVTPSERARSELSQVTAGFISGMAERDAALSRLHSPLESNEFIRTIETEYVYECWRYFLSISVETTEALGVHAPLPNSLVVTYHFEPNRPEKMPTPPPMCAQLLDIPMPISECVHLV